MTKKLSDKEKIARAQKKAKAEGKFKEATSKGAKKAAKGKKKPKVAMVKPYGKEPKELAPVGHNRGQYSEALVAKFVELEELAANKKEISKAERDIVGTIKSEFNISSAVVKHELRLRRMDSDVRSAFEHGVEDLHSMIGYQMALALDTGEDDAAEAQEGQEDDDSAPHESQDDLEDMEAAGAA